MKKELLDSAGFRICAVTICLVYSLSSLTIGTMDNETPNAARLLGVCVDCV